MTVRKVIACCKTKLISPDGIARAWHLEERSFSVFSRVPRLVYTPEKDGVVPGKNSLARLPNQPKRKHEPAHHTKASGEIFKRTMEEIFATKSKRHIAVEGMRQVDDAISYGLHPKVLFLLKDLKKISENVEKLVTQRCGESQSYAQVQSQLPEVHRISLKSMREWSAMDTPPGIVGIFQKPTSPVSQVPVDRRVPLTVVLDNIREPGNLGSILRTAAGIGCQVLLSEGCVDPWETKCLRGGNGAQFLVPMSTHIDLNYLHQYLHMPCSEYFDKKDGVSTQNGNGIGVFLADSGSDTNKLGVPITDYTHGEYSNYEEVVLILGGETTGLSDTVTKAAVELIHYYPAEVKHVSRIRIPMNLPIDSLNVANAFGIIGYEILRQFSKSKFT